MKTVFVRVRTTGTNFACVASLRDAKSGRKLAETRVFPSGFEHAAKVDALAIAADKGWKVAS